MLPIADWLLLVGVCLLGAMTPGASLAVVTRHTMLKGAGAGVRAGIAHAFGIALWAIASVTGLALLFMTLPWLETLLSVAGALFLLWLGARILRHAGSGKTSHDILGQRQTPLRDGFVIALLNPKVGLFFLALFSHFVGASDSIAGKLQIVLTVTLIDGSWYVLAALTLGQGRLLPWLRAHQIGIERATALVLIATAVMVFISTIKGQLG